MEISYRRGSIPFDLNDILSGFCQLKVISPSSDQDDASFGVFVEMLRRIDVAKSEAERPSKHGVDAFLRMTMRQHLVPCRYP